MTPDTLYHVTDSVMINNIYRDGLKPEFSNYSTPAVWAFDDIEYAKRAAEKWSWSYMGEPAIITINRDGMLWVQDGCMCGNLPGDHSQHAWKCYDRIAPAHLGTVIEPDRVDVEPWLVS